jgi:hypothetical protein
MRDWERELRRRLAPLRLPPAREAEIVEEMAQHLDDRYRELRARGAAEADAIQAALDEMSDDGALALGLGAVERPAPAAGARAAPSRAPSRRRSTSRPRPSAGPSGCRRAGTPAPMDAPRAASHMGRAPRAVHVGAQR